MSDWKANDRIPFRPLKTELSDELAAPGFHDLNRIHVLERWASDRLVIAHEEIHDKLLKETVFGTFQRVLRQLRDAVPDGELRAYVDGWLNVTIEHSRLTHECSATYLSITAADVRDHAAMLAVLPLEYRSYFDRLASVVDRVFQSTYIRYIAAKVISEVAMATSLDEASRQFEKLASPHLPLESQPDRRFEALLTLARCDLPTLVDEVRSAVRVLDTPPTGSFDVESDESWVTLDLETASAVEKTIFDVLRRRLYAAGSTLSETIPVDRFFSYVNAITQTLYRVCDVPVAGDLWQPASAQSNAVIINSPPTPDLHQRAVLLDGSDSAQFEWALGATAYVSVKPDEEQEPTEWYVFRRTSNGKAEVARMTTPMFWSLLKSRRRLIGVGSPIPELPTILSGFSSQHGGAFARFHNELVKHHSLGSSVFGLEKITWYWSGDLLRWIHLIASHGAPIELMPFVSEEAYAASRSGGNYKGLSIRELQDIDRDLPRMPMWVVMRSPNLAGRAIRALPGLGDFAGQIEDAMSRGIVASVPVHEREGFGAPVVEILKSIVPSFWSAL